ncbi:MAG: SDR family oxidoreductase, partial [Deltaproteobacteria bacterium]|nr:SDR family oxidoreductase [Deltaproteobacteria bacterium]
MTKRLENKVAVVIGAGQQPGDTLGNGRATAMLFAREGAEMILVDRNFESARETQNIIEREGGWGFSIEADITRIEDCENIVKQCMESRGRIDALVYNVGTGEGRGSIDLPVKNWDTIFNVNLNGAFYLYKFVLPVMEEQGSGSIVNISSVAAISNTNMLAYKSSKAALNAFTQTIAMMYAGKGVRVNAIMPGLIDTPMAIEGLSVALKMSKDELRSRRNKRVPLKGGMGEAWDVAYAAL